MVTQTRTIADRASWLMSRARFDARGQTRRCLTDVLVMQALQFSMMCGAGNGEV